MVSVPITYDGNASSGLESNESKRSISMVVDNNLDSTGVSCENGAYLNASECASDVCHIPYEQEDNRVFQLVWVT